MISILSHCNFTCNFSCNHLSKTRLLNQRSAQNLTYSTHFLGHYIVYLFFNSTDFVFCKQPVMDLLGILSLSMFYFLSDFCASSVKKEHKCCSRDRCWVLEQLTEPCFMLKYSVHRPGFSPFSADLQQCCRFAAFIFKQCAQIGMNIHLDTAAIYIVSFLIWLNYWKQHFRERKRVTKGYFLKLLPTL